ncbi:hypothetical protein OAU37_00760 [Gammaproteobacteria bacterium]|nr:hypothetical protein [Gammaproteobacteria bacterium]
MGIFSKLFGNKKKDKNLSDMLDDAGLELEVSFGDDSEELNEEDYKYNHCFVFYGLNDEAFTVIENQVQNFDGPDHLSLLRSMEGVLMTDLCGQNAGSKKVKEAMKTDDDSVAYVNQRVDQYLEIIKENFDSQIGEDCLELIELEKPYIVENIRCAMKVWADSEFFEKENFVGAMITFVKSSKEFDRKDEISENQNGMNLPLVTRGGFIRDCIFATEDVINVKYDVDEIEEKIWRNAEGNNPRNSCNYVPSFYMAPFGFNYFDQDGQLWRISDVGKAVQLASEWEKDFVNDNEDAVEYYVSH